MLVASLATPAAAQHAHPALRVEASLDGVKLVLTLPRRTYPRGALARVTLRVENLYPNSVSLHSRCGIGNPAVEVLDSSGATAYPPPTAPPPIDYQHVMCRSAPPPRFTRPQSFDVTEYVLLRGGQIRAVAAIDVLQGSGTGRTIQMATLVTPSITVRLTRPHRPSLVLRKSRSGLYAVLRIHGRRVTKDVYYSDWFRCPSGDGPALAGNSFLYSAENSDPLGAPFISGAPYGWSVYSVDRLQAGCPHPLEWHLAAAVLNQPAATLDYPPS